jgi:tetratricopeptide (TPR) repeat protein
VAFAAAAVALAAGLAAIALVRPWSAEPTEARLLLAAGEVERGDVAVGIDSALREGTELRVAEGEAVVAAGTATRIWVAANTRLRLSRLDASRAEVALEHGEVWAAVEPHESNLTIETRDGRIRVTGTAFGVRVEPRETVVEVARGSVVVGSRSQVVVAGQRFALRSGQLERLSAQQQKDAEHRVQSLMALHSVGEHGRLEIQSVPGGAAVFVDGRFLARAPLRAQLTLGRHHLEARSGEQVVSEWIEVTAGAWVKRDFDLRSRGEEPGAVGTEIEEERSGVDVQRVPKVGRGRQGRAARAPPSSVELLARARARRSVGDWSGALRIYDRVVDRFAGTRSAGVARVSRGEVLLDHRGSPQRALRDFEEYLRHSPSGALAQEAAFGRCRALLTLGRNRDARQALEAFLRDYPLAVQGKQARRSLDRLSAP